VAEWAERDQLPDQPFLLERSLSRDVLPEVRQAVADCATASGLADLAATKFVLAVSEVTVNAVFHGGGQGRLWLWRSDESLWCQVTDRGAGIPARYRAGRRYRSSGDRLGGGTGLWLAAHMCAEMRIGDGLLGGAVVLLRYELPRRA
jgi:serine/threonine-protein kinase RsbW